MTEQNVERVIISTPGWRLSLGNKKQLYGSRHMLTVTTSLIITSAKTPSQGHKQIHHEYTKLNS